MVEQKYKFKMKQKFYLINFKNKNIKNIINKKIFINRYNNFLKESDKKFLFVLEIEKEIIGFIESIIIKDINECEIYYIEIMKEYRNKHFGYDLLKNFLDLLKNLNISNIFLEVRFSNTVAINLYKKLNFVYIGTRKKYYSYQEDAYLMKKVLN